MEMLNDPDSMMEKVGVHSERQDEMRTMEQQMDDENAVEAAAHLQKQESNQTMNVDEMSDRKSKLKGVTKPIVDEGGAGDNSSRPVRTSTRFLRSPVKRDKLSGVKQAPDHKQEDLFCTKVQVELFSCNHCQICFETLDEIKQHLQEQPEHRAPRRPKEKPFKCKTCGKGYVSKVMLNKHVRKLHRKLPVRKPKKKTEEENMEEVKENENEENGEDEDIEPVEEEMDDAVKDEDYVGDTRMRNVRSKKILKCDKNRVQGSVKKTTGRGVPSLECDMCDHVAINMNDFREHQSTHAGEEIKCRICDRTATDFRRLRKHFRQQHRPGKKWRVCEICGHKSSGPSSLALHLATHTGMRNFKCETCGMRFVRRYAMLRHNEVKHLQIRRYQCTRCDQKFGTNFALQKHEEYHTEDSEKTFFCEVCAEGFVRENVLRWHQNYYHGDNPKPVTERRLPYDRNRGPVPGLDVAKRELPFPCSLCKRAFSSHAVRERHMRAFHSDDTSLLCKICGVRFGSQSRYEQHVASHNGLTSHKCRYCNKEFKRDHLRQVHESCKHTGDRPYKCTCCDEKFINKARMYAHRLVHYGREIKCDYCDRNFASHQLKKRHMRKHSEFKEFQCHICHKEYKQKSNYNAHMKIHTGAKPYQCDHCDERFMDLPTLRKHLALHQIPQQLQQQPPQQVQESSHQHLIQILNQSQSIQAPPNIQILPQNLHHQTLQPVQHLQIVQQQQHPQHQQMDRGQQQQQIIHASMIQQQVGQIEQQLAQLPQTGEPIDLVAYNCDVCGQMFLSTDALIAHCQTHVMEAHAQRPCEQGRQSQTTEISLFGMVSEASEYY